MCYVSTRGIENLQRHALCSQGGAEGMYLRVPQIAIPKLLGHNPTFLGDSQKDFLVLSKTTFIKLAQQL